MHHRNTFRGIGEQIALTAGVVKTQLPQDVPGLLLDLRIIGRARLLIKMLDGRFCQLQIVAQLLALAGLHVFREACNRLLSDRAGLIQVVSGQQCSQNNNRHQCQQQHPRLDGQILHVVCFPWLE